MGKKFISALIAVLSFTISVFCNTEQDNLIKEADLWLDMMEYRSAIVNYMKVLANNPQFPDIRKNMGYAYFQLGKIDEAIISLKQELELFPANGNAYDLLVHILHRQNRIEEAYEFLQGYGLYRKEDKGNTNSGLGDFILGKYFKDKADFDKAKRFFRLALSRGCTPLRCYVQLADIELIQENYPEFSKVMAEAKKADKELYELHKEGYEIFESYFLNGLMYYKQFQIEYERIFYRLFLYLRLAFKSFQEALALNPDSKETLFNLGCLNYNLGQFAEASEYFKRILKQEPENPEIRFYLDCCTQYLGGSEYGKERSKKCPESLSLSKEFIDKPPMEYRYQFKNDLLFVLQNISHLALEFIQNGRIQEGLKRYQNGLKIYPESPELNFNLGTVYLWQKDFKNAERHALIALRRKYYYVTMPDFLIPGRINRQEREEFLRKAQDSIHRHPDIPLSEWAFEVALKEGNYFCEAYDLLGNIYFKKGDLDSSLLAFKKVIELTQEDAMAHYNLGCTYWALNDWENAEREWRNAIKYEREAKKREGRTETSKNKLSFSLLVYKWPASFRAHKALGELYLKRNLSDKALGEFEKAIELEPDDPEPYYEIGKLYQAKSEQDEKYVRKSIFYYEKYLYLGGEKEEEVKEILKSLKKNQFAQESIVPTLFLCGRLHLSYEDVSQSRDSGDEFEDGSQ